MKNRFCGMIKTKLYDERDDFTFPIGNFPFISSNITSSPAYEVYISQLPYVILKLVLSTMMFWTELSCWRKSYSNKATLLLSWSHRYKNCTVVITIWLTVTKDSYLKSQWIFCFLRRFFLSSITAKTFDGLDCIYE